MPTAKRQLMASQRGWVWFPTRQTANAGRLAVFAIFQTSLAVVAIPSLAVYLSTYWPLLGAAVLSPFLLLRSRKSTRLGVRLFYHWKDRWQIKPKPFPGKSDWIALAVVVGTAVSLTWFALLAVVDMLGTDNPYIVIFISCSLSLYFVGFASVCAPEAFAHIIGWAKKHITAVSLCAASVLLLCPLQFFVATNASFSQDKAIGALVLLVVIALGIFWATKSTLELSSTVTTKHALVRASQIVVLPMVIGYGSGVLLVAITIRCGATVRFLFDGLEALPRNYRRVVSCESIFLAPELIPGLDRHKTGFNFAAVKGAVTSSEARSLRAMNGLLLLVWFIPSIVYRFSLKSTFWAWWSIAFIGQPPSFEHDPRYFYQRAVKDKLRRWLLILPFMTIVSFIFVSLVRSCPSEWCSWIS